MEQKIPHASGVSLPPVFSPQNHVSIVSQPAAKSHRTMYPAVVNMAATRHAEIGCRGLSCDCRPSSLQMLIAKLSQSQNEGALDDPGTPARDSSCQVYRRWRDATLE